MTVRQLFNEVDEIQCEAIIQQYDYEKNDYEFRVCLSELYLKCTQSQGHNEIPKTRELLCDHRCGQKLFFMHRRFALQRINA